MSNGSSRTGQRTSRIEGRAVTKGENMMKINWNRPLVAITVWAVLSIIVAVGSLAEAHRSGCHRWHSCPSDTGSYVCGDLGYNTYCPNLCASTSRRQGNRLCRAATEATGAGDWRRGVRQQ